MDNQLFQYVPQIYYGMAPADQYRLMMQQAGTQIQRGLQTQFAGTSYPINM